MTPITPSPPSNMEVETLYFGGVFLLRGQLHRIKEMMDGAIYCQGQGIENRSWFELPNVSLETLMTWRGSAKRSGTKSLLRCVQTWWPTTRNIWPLWLPTRVLPPSNKLCFGEGVKYLFHSLKCKSIYNLFGNVFFWIFCCYSVSHCSNKPTIEIIDWTFLCQWAKHNQRGIK